MTVTDENKRSIAYNPELYEVAVQGMAMKARWLARRLRRISERVLVALDEPYLCSFGSAFVNVPRNDVIAAIDGAVAGSTERARWLGCTVAGTRTGRWCWPPAWTSSTSTPGNSRRGCRCTPPSWPLFSTRAAR